MPSITVDSVVKKYKKKTIGPISFSFKNVNILSIVGPNGAGKTTLVTIISGTRKPTAGKIYINGKDKYTVAYLPETEGAPDDYTIEEYAEILATAYRISKKELVDAAVKETGLSPKTAFSSMSKGQKRRVLLSIIMSLPADVLILDEPFSGLDVISRYKWKQKIKSLSGEDKLVIITSHDMFEVEEISDDVVLIHDGKVKFYGKVNDIKKETGCSTLECAFMRIIGIS